jgi:hypothetical protein
MSVADHLLPVFSFRPNWKRGITERLEWLTAILSPKTSGAEQRIGLRLSPRRSFEAEIEPLGAERTFFDLFLRRFGAGEFTLPLWHDRGALDTAAGSGAVALSFDTTDREFVSGGMALLMGADAFSCEAVRLDIVTAGGATLVAGTTRDWPAGTVIHPLRRSRFDGKPDVGNVTDRLASSNLTFELAQANDYDGGAEELATFGGIPILAPAPNWSRELDVDYFRDIANIDNQVGLRTVVDLPGRSFTSQFHRWMIEGRADLAAFYRLLYRLRGRQQRIWLPTFTGDLVLAADAAVAATSIDVVHCGLDYADFPDDGRDKAITGAGSMLQFTSLAASPGIGIERLNLSAPLDAALNTGDALSWVDIGRLDSDAIELHHLTDSDGVTSVEAPFRSFADTRDGSAAGVIEIPETEMNDTPCGLAETVCMVEFVVDLPDPLPTLTEPVTYANANLYFEVWIDKSWYGAGSSPIAVNLTTTPNSGFSFIGHPYPVGIDEFFDVSWNEWLGGSYPTDVTLFRFKYDSTANTLTVQVFAPILNVPDDFAQPLEVQVTGEASTTAGGDLIASVTQSLNGGTPVALAVHDAGSRNDFVDGGSGIAMAERFMQFSQLKQRPCGAPYAEFEFTLPAMLTSWPGTP